MGIGELSRMDNLDPYQLEYDLKEKQFYVLSKIGRFSIYELRHESHELRWKEGKTVDSILKWLNENYPELLI